MTSCINKLYGYQNIIQTNNQIKIKNSIIKNNDFFVFEYNYCDSYNIIDDLIYNEVNVKILNPGFYILNVTCQIDQNSQIGLVVNNEIKSLFDSENNLINIHEIMKFTSNDIIKIQNLSNSYIQITDNSHVPSNNFILIQKII